MSNHGFLAQEVWGGARTLHQSATVPPGFPPPAGVQGSWKWGLTAACGEDPSPGAWDAGAAGGCTPTAQLQEWAPDGHPVGREAGSSPGPYPLWACIGWLLPGDLRPPASSGDPLCLPSPTLLRVCPWTLGREQGHSSGLPRGAANQGQPTLRALPWKRFDQPGSADLPPSEPVSAEASVLERGSQDPEAASFWPRGWTRSSSPRPRPPVCEMEQNERHLRQGCGDDKIPQQVPCASQGRASGQKGHRYQALRPRTASLC